MLPLQPARRGQSAARRPRHRRHSQAKDRQNQAKENKKESAKRPDRFLPNRAKPRTPAPIPHGINDLAESPNPEHPGVNKESLRKHNPSRQAETRPTAARSAVSTALQNAGQPCDQAAPTTAPPNRRNEAEAFAWSFLCRTQLLRTSKLAVASLVCRWFPAVRSTCTRYVYMPGAVPALIVTLCDEV